MEQKTGKTTFVILLRKKERKKERKKKKLSLEHWVDKFLTLADTDTIPASLPYHQIGVGIGIGFQIYKYQASGSRFRYDFGTMGPEANLTIESVSESGSEYPRLITSLVSVSGSEYPRLKEEKKTLKEMHAPLRSLP